MSRFSIPRREQPLDRSKAWACAAVNLLLWPGLGTTVCGRLHGLIQMGISGAGVVLVLIGFAGCFGKLIDTGQLPSSGDKYAVLILGGFGMFALMWCWAVLSSVFILRAVPRKPPKMSS